MRQQRHVPVTHDLLLTLHAREPKFWVLPAHAGLVTCVRTSMTLTRFLLQNRNQTKEAGAHPTEETEAEKQRHLLKVRQQASGASSTMTNVSLSLPVTQII